MLGQQSWRGAHSRSMHCAAEVVPCYLFFEMKAYLEQLCRFVLAS